ncbi:MAG: DNA translocase FtsK [Alphaproteobacteria bacterium]|nr:DNA translocase FtsK [Alphaproteobacteria bacterium]
MPSIASPLDHLPDPFRDFLVRRLSEAAGIVLIALALAVALALATWSVQDPSLSYASNQPVRNLLGFPGSVAADLLMQTVGLASLVFLAPLGFWGWRFLTHQPMENWLRRIPFWTLGTVCATAVFALMPVTDRWPLPGGLGGVIGDAILRLPGHVGLGGPMAQLAAGALCACAAILLIKLAVSPKKTPESSADFERLAPLAAPSQKPAHQSEADEAASGEPGWMMIAAGAVCHHAISLKSKLMRLFVRREPVQRGRAHDRPFDEPFMERQSSQPALDLRNPPAPHMPNAPDGAFAQQAYHQGQAQDAVYEEAATVSGNASQAATNSPTVIAGTATPRVSQPAPAIKTGKRILRESQPSLLDRNRFELPPLLLLSEAKRTQIGKLSEDALEQNARLLEGVLEDFGVKGEIINVRPGPVVTLYELEPAPGIKSSRVIGLADDIARSMSAVSARVSVVSGRNAIGIELPNQRRETVFLRELLASEDFERNKHRLAIALGKTIGGEPVIVDLARMPHLLVAGTTGSGKSVAINTMILSLLYRLKPEECKLIMVDPKMLELSVYDGIPHLLTPVVTDPKKAVVALKWAVREMEDRYKKMSKVGVRNIDGFNARAAEAQAKGEKILRTVQTGYDKETGEAIFEQEEIDISVLPYIVIIVDEMADLMMVAGKDIEGAIQRLAQMARAAGIHLIMATQRPSVDVITGTIKANFPTRISFQVTSKIDSRTILGEQGAEQLLGQGDMLYMAGGGRISRVHGPFVSDSEVEKVVAHLKTQGAPQYLDAITADEETGDEEDGDFAPPGSMDAEEALDLYDRAVAIVLRDQKCSTSYIQRRLSVGYNKAASLVERMEREGVVSPANHSGKREILAGAGSAARPFEEAGS